ncbi:MAG: hypothetical protein AAF919_15385 [Pseudomonadota bacterium]
MTYAFTAQGGYQFAGTYDVRSDPNQRTSFLLAQAGRLGGTGRYTGPPAPCRPLRSTDSSTMAPAI